MHFGEIEPVRLRQGQGIDLRPAHHHGFVLPFDEGHVLRQGHRLVQGRHYLGSLRLKIRLASNHDIGTTRERLAQGIPGLAAHDHWLAKGDLLEVLEVVGQIPGQLVVTPDDTVTGLGHHQGKSDGHEKTL